MSFDNCVLSFLHAASTAQKCNLMKSAFQNTFRTRSSTRSRTRDARHFERILERVTGSDQLNRNQFDNTRNLSDFLIYNVQW